ncbi:trypsin-like peptidase domain-containing protein [Mesorhizobium sp. M0676]|uniref:trypsin-like serine peptidase n=1 Tax=Mesorhizobium sp. M0676 TaxID=2956984 RepID=UPI0033369B94
MTPLPKPTRRSAKRESGYALPPTAGDIVADATSRTRLGLMSETNGGSSIEKVPGFNMLRPLTAGFGQKTLADPAILASTPDGGYFSTLPRALRPPTEGYGPQGKPEDVIGIDDRVQVVDTSVIPWRCICHLEITYQSGQVGFGTGWFAGPRTIITAAHCLFTRGESPQTADQIRIVPGRNGRLAPYGYALATQFKWAPGWEKAKTDAEAAAHDYGAIFLDKDSDVNGAPFGDRIGYFGMRWYAANEEAQLDMSIVNTAGYPHEATKAYGTMWFNAGRVRIQKTGKPAPQFLEYMVDTTGGQSGSPVFALDSKNNQRLVVAIHTTGNFVNRGVRLTAEVFETLSSWVGPMG